MPRISLYLRYWEKSEKESLLFLYFIYLRIRRLQVFPQLAGEGVEVDYEKDPLHGPRDHQGNQPQGEGGLWPRGCGPRLLHPRDAEDRQDRDVRGEYGARRKVTLWSYGSRSQIPSFSTGMIEAGNVWLCRSVRQSSSGIHP